MQEKKRFIHGVSIALLLIGLGALVFLVVIPLLFSKPFSGTLEHDFGVVEVESPQSTFEYIFSLTNETGGAVKLVNAVPTCGCTTTDWPKHIVQAGELLEVPVHLTLKRSEVRRSKIRLEFDNGENLVLRVEGAGRLSQPLSCKPHNIKIVEGDPIGARGLLKLEKFDKGIPSIPKMTAPENVTINLESWRHAKAGDFGQGKPNEWTLAFECLLDGTLEEGEELTIQYEAFEPLTIQLEQSKSREKPRFFN